MAVINYTNEYSGLPYNIMTRTNFRDITDEDAEVVNQVKVLQSEGRYADAANLVEGSDLDKCVISSKYINGIDEETRNLEIMCKSKKQSVYYMEDEPGFGVAGDVWISEEEIL